MSSDSLRSALSALWEKSRDTILERVTTLETATRDLLKGQLAEETRRNAERDAHKLAGAAGTFGFPDASTLARQAEEILAGTDPVAHADVLRLSNIAVQLRQQLEDDGTKDKDETSDAAKRPLAEAAPRLLLISKDEELVERLAVEARMLNVDVRSIEEIDDARRELSSDVDAAVLDLSLTDAGIPFLEEMHAVRPDLPVVVLSGDGEFKDRVEAARLRGRGFLQKPVRPSQVIDLLRDVLVVSRDELPTIVAVDDDAELLGAIELLLAPTGARVIRCNDPLRALNYLVEHSPDLVMLDVDMPELSGIELCRVLRNDPRWASVPVLFLTSKTEPANVARMFEAGADDFVGKPVLGPELVARVRNRLERTRMLKLAANVDSLTGVATRRRGIEVLDRYFRLAQRQHQPISIGVIDLDHFKEVNDRYGHLSGDMVLRHVASVLLGAFRGEDIVARWGGEEFVVGMYSMPEATAVRRLEQALGQLREETFESIDPSLRVTFSAGVAEFPRDGADWMALYRVADEALGRAKAAGRNRVVTASPSAG